MTDPTAARGRGGAPEAGPPRPDPRIRVVHLSGGRQLRDELAEAVRTGLTAEPRRLPSKYAYDDRGSALFERITQLPGYYLTRAETAILAAHAAEIVDAVRPAELVELGSGSSRKTRLLLEAMHARGTGEVYVPIDVSDAALRSAAATLAADHPWLRVHGLVGDFHADLARIPPNGRRLVAFLGSTIGNLGEPERAVLFADVARLLAPGDAFLLGADLVKDPATLVAAYDDPEGVTAEFNRNVLRVVDRVLDADVPVAAFRHRARWDPVGERVECSLQATEALTLRFPSLPLTVDLGAGEEIHTWISTKFRREGLTAELAAAGLRVDRWLTDPQERFAVVVASCA